MLQHTSWNLEKKNQLSRCWYASVTHWNPNSPNLLLLLLLFYSRLFLSVVENKQCLFLNIYTNNEVPKIGRAKQGLMGILG